MATQVLGLDIGGANLKAAHSDGTARTVPFALWKHPERLSAELASLCETMPTHDRLAVTMTGELCDCFANRREGVAAILASVRAMAGKTPVRVWCKESEFLEIDDGLDDPLGVASANWLAQAKFVAQRFPDESVLLIDTGSTTTDIVYLHRGTPQPRGWADMDRMAFGELVYTGVRRTPICAVLGMRVAAELFATMLDSYVVAGLVPENPQDCDTADGRPATLPCAHARLARMLCTDTEVLPIHQARQFAERALAVQWRTVDRAMNRVIQGRSAVQRIVLSGSGEILGRSMCARSKLASVPVTSLAESLGPDLSHAACAYAVAILAAQEVDDGR
jgi:(4-(4-[2-(gamma-L-glutamylamino)ethyl]phenoxymethyl)furan-2-yl)methanamine synthase